MKALSLWEPWASLIRTGAKTWETRSWGTTYRGPLLICAAKHGQRSDDVQSLLSDWRFQEGLMPLVGRPLWYVSFTNYVKMHHLSFGDAVAVVELTDCKQTGRLIHGNALNEMELIYGNFALGRFGWKLENIRPVKPFPVKGRHGLFNVDCESLIEYVKLELNP